MIFKFFKKIVNLFKKKEIEIFKGDYGITLVIFQKVGFVIDEEDLDYFNNEFNKKPYRLVIVRSKNRKGKEILYLARDNKNSNTPEYYHRLIMNKEIENFCKSKGCSKSEVVVHHINFNTKINTKSNLNVMTREQHDRLHNLNRDNLSQIKITNY